MNNLKTLVLIGCMGFLLAACGTKENNSSEETPAAETPAETVAVTSGKYKIKSGVVNFDIEGFGQKSKRVLYFDDFGSKERVEEYNPDGTLKEFRISDGKDRYNVQPESKTAWLADHNGNIGWEMQFFSYDELEKRQSADGFSKLPDMNVAGKECPAIQYKENNKFAGWNGVTLYHEQTNISKMTATSIEEKDVEASMFAVPDGYEVKEFKY